MFISQSHATDLLLLVFGKATNFSWYAPGSGFNILYASCHLAPYTSYNLGIIGAILHVSKFRQISKVEQY
jgi:hypothetical protein